jgi:hypothetical protein
VTSVEAPPHGTECDPFVVALTLEKKQRTSGHSDLSL